MALVVFGPDRLPKMMRQAGKAFRSFQSESQRALSDLRQAVDTSDLKSEFEPIVMDSPNDVVAATIKPEPKPKPVRKATAKKAPAKAKAGVAKKKKAAPAKRVPSKPIEPPPLEPALPAAYPSLEDT